MRTVAFKMQDSIHHMFQYPRPCDLAFLGYVTDKNNRYSGWFGITDNFLRRSTHLRHSTRRAINIVNKHRLNRINNYQLRRIHLVLNTGHNFTHIRTGRQLHRRIGQPQTLRAHTHLIDRLFAGDIQATLALFCQRTDNLQQQGRFPDPRIAANQRGRARH